MDGTIKNEEGASGTSFSGVFGEHLCEIAEENEKVVAITAAMPDGTGLGGFAKKFRKRFYDVGICEQHGVGLATGLSRAGLKPVFAVYSTFLQRAYDQLFHEVALQGEDVILCIDRAGLVGNDGPTHHGLLDISYARVMNGFVLMAPHNAPELRRMMDLAVEGDFPAVIRYPRETVPEKSKSGETPQFGVGEAEVLRDGADGAIVAYGIMVKRALAASEELSADGIEISVVNARFARPLDMAVIGELVRKQPAVLLAEDHSVSGGFGSAVLEGLADEGIDASRVRVAGVPREWVTHASREAQLEQLRLDGPGLADRLRKLLR
jgi:1-deoxy-D-xylulose-5-phosphate synthase